MLNIWPSVRQWNLLWGYQWFPQHQSTLGRNGVRWMCFQTQVRWAQWGIAGRIRVMDGQKRWPLLILSCVVAPGGEVNGRLRSRCRSCFTVSLSRIMDLDCKKTLWNPASIQLLEHPRDEEPAQWSQRRLRPTWRGVENLESSSLASHGPF